MVYANKIINKDAWRDIYRLQLTIDKMEKIFRESYEPILEEEEAEEIPEFRPKANIRELKARQLQEHKRILWQLKKENPTEPLGKELLEILESMKN